MAADTYIYYDTNLQALVIVVDGVEVARFKTNGDVDLNADANENAF